MCQVFGYSFQPQTHSSIVGFVMPDQDSAFAGGHLLDSSSGWGERDLQDWKKKEGTDTSFSWVRPSGCLLLGTSNTALT